MNFGVDEISNIINNISTLEKEAAVGFGLAVEPLDRDEKYNLTIGFPQVVGVSRNFGTNTIRPIIGAGFPVPVMPGIGYFPEQRRIHLSDEQLEKVKSNRKLRKEYNRLNRLRRSPSEDEIRNLIEMSTVDKQLEKKVENDEMSNLIEKLTAETIKEYIEKEAIAPAIAAAGRSAMPKLKQMFTSARNSLGTLTKKPEVAKGMATGTSNQANTVADWGSEISKSWSQSRKLGANVLGSAGNAWRAGMAANPTLSTGVVTGTGALAVGGVTGAVIGKRRKNNQPNITINAAVIESDLDKQALFENSDPLDMLMKGVISGAAIGTSIALGGKLKGVQARNQVYAADTKNIRGMFDNLKPFTAEANTFMANRNADLVSQIPDKRLRDIFISTLEDGGKLVENLKKTLPKNKLPELQKQLQDELNRNRATLPTGVQTRLQKMIDSILEEEIRRV